MRRSGSNQHRVVECIDPRTNGVRGAHRGNEYARLFIDMFRHALLDDALVADGRVGFGEADRDVRQFWMMHGHVHRHPSTHIDIVENRFCTRDAGGDVGMSGDQRERCAYIRQHVRNEKIQEICLYEHDITVFDILGFKRPPVRIARMTVQMHRPVLGKSIEMMIGQRLPEIVR